MGDGFPWALWSLEVEVEGTVMLSAPAVLEGP